MRRDRERCAVLGGSRFNAPYRCARDSPTQSLLELELLVDAGVLAGAGVEELDELPVLDELESLLDDDVAGVDAADDELSDVAAFDDGLDPPRLSVL